MANGGKEAFRIPRRNLYIFQTGQYAEAFHLTKRMIQEGIDAVLLTKHALQVREGQEEQAREVANQWMLERLRKDPARAEILDPPSGPAAEPDKKD